MCQQTDTAKTQREKENFVMGSQHERQRNSLKFHKHFHALNAIAIKLKKRVGEGKKNHHQHHVETAAAATADE
jgi:hypothetical protein